MPRVFELEWLFEPFADHQSFIRKHMFGGLSAYYRGRIVMCLAEEPRDAVWNGVLFPTEREFHASLRQAFPSLRRHKILPKWLYLSRSAVDFEETALALARLIARQDARLGVVPKTRKKRIIR